MLRVAMSGIILGMSAMPISSDAHCDIAYGAFTERLTNRGPSLSSSQLIDMHRRVECTPASGQGQAADFTIFRACSCANVAGLL